MVCPRCISSVQQLLTGMSLQPVSVKLGEAVIDTDPDKNVLLALSQKLSLQGFELLEDNKLQVIDKIKSVIIERIQKAEIVNAELIADALGRDYSGLSKLFSSNENITIEKFIILQKIEKVKELLAYNQLTLSEIAYMLGYSSVSHLSAQFKKVTGYSPTAFKLLENKPRLPLDSLS